MKHKVKDRNKTDDLEAICLPMHLPGSSGMPEPLNDEVYDK
jgi:hypothetical protein